MTTIYLINNSLTMNNLAFPDKESLEQKREKRILSILGEEESRRLVQNKDLQNLMTVAKKISRSVRKKIGATGINILHASGKDAGQSVQHFHLHLFPRFKDDKVNAWPQLPENSFNKEEIFRKIVFIK